MYIQVENNIDKEIQLKKQIFHTVGTVPKYKKQIYRDIGKKDSTNTHIHFELGTGTLIKSDEVSNQN